MPKVPEITADNVIAALAVGAQSMPQLMSVFETTTRGRWITLKCTVVGLIRSDHVRSDDGSCHSLRLVAHPPVVA